VLAIRFKSSGDRPIHVHMYLRNGKREVEQNAADASDVLEHQHQLLPVAVSKVLAEPTPCAITRHIKGRHLLGAVW